MGDVMTFPKEPKEFIDQYSFRDSEQVYTNGSELIPVFRVKQMLDHYLPEQARSIVKKLEDMRYNNIDTHIFDGADEAFGGAIFAVKSTAGLE
jgi:hypothetical protein